MTYFIGQEKRSSIFSTISQEILNDIILCAMLSLSTEGRSTHGLIGISSPQETMDPFEIVSYHGSSSCEIFMIYLIFERFSIIFFHRLGPAR